MKKRIIGMLLLVCMLVTALASCAYSYENDDMSKYVTFDKDAFIAGLQKLEITDADFGTDPDVREAKVWDAIYTTLAGKADTDDHKTEGNPDKYDLLYYCYYATYEEAIEGSEDKNTVIVYASSMKESAATKLQLTLTSNKDLNKEIANAVAELISGETPAGLKYYKTNTTGTVGGNATVVVTYTETVKTTDGGTVSKTYTNKIETLPAGITGDPVEGSTDPTAANFLEYLIGKEVNKDLGKVSFGTGADEKSYSGIRINWVIESGMDGEITVKHTPFTEKKEVKAVDGSTVDLKDKELTYHVFPAYFIETPALDAEIILDQLLGTSFKAGGDADKNGTIEDSEKGTLEIFTDDGYKNGDETLNAMVTKLIELLSDRSTKQTALDNAKKAYDEAKSAHDKATTPTQDQINALTSAETALNKAKEELGEENEDGSFTGGAKKAVADQIAKILAAVKEGSDVTIADAIVTSYKDYRYDSLENSYKSAIKSSLAQAIYDLAIKTITYSDNLPEQAVNEAYDLLINNYEYDFYEGNYSDSSSSSTSTTTKTNYEQFGGNFLSYLIAELGMKTTSTKDEVYAAIREDAKKAVKEKILIYVLKTACAEADKVAVTREDVDNFKAGINYLLLQYYMGQNNVKESYYMPALQFDKIMNYFLEVDETNEDNKIKYVRIAYEFKAEDADEKAGE